MANRVSMSMPLHGAARHVSFIHISMLIWPVSEYANSISAAGTAAPDILKAASSLSVMVYGTSLPFFHIALKLIT
jgi:hypothetical protein